MRFFATPRPAMPPKTEAAMQMAIFYAVLLVIMAVAQLFTFDSFIELFMSFNLPLSAVAAAGVAPLLVACEVFALPFLLRMALSPAFRWVSMVCGWMVPVLWLLISTWAVIHPAIMSVGFLGTVTDLIPGWWAVSLSGLMVVMTAWASWGLWPRRKTS